MAIPEPPGSVPDQLTGKESLAVAMVVAGRSATALLTVELSIVSVTVLVRIGAFTSETMLAWLVMAVPLPRPDLGFTGKTSEPTPALVAPSGGRKPARGFAGEPPVTGSTDCMVQVRRPVAGLSAATTDTGLESVATVAWER
jgi:hypothetical protein